MAMTDTSMVDTRMAETNLLVVDDARVDENAVPCWRAVHELLVKHGVPVQIRMTDGEPAVPDEILTWGAF